MPKRHRHAAHRRSGEIVFDPEARGDYLRGFSSRKKQRRAYGLAMQKVKDRQAKLEERAELRKAVEEQVQQAEQQKQELLGEYLSENGVRVNDDDDEEEQSVASTAPLDKVETFNDAQAQWGGDVIVRTSTNIPGDSDEDIDPQPAPKKKRKDVEQEYAGHVEKFMSKIQAKMPSKKKDQGHRHKGKHGAAGMKGMAKGDDLKLAQKALERSQAKTKKKGGKRRR